MNRQNNLAKPAQPEKEILDAITRIGAKRLVIDSLSGLRWRWHPVSALIFASPSTE